jgi:hypothetical protein
MTLKMADSQDLGHNPTHGFRLIDGNRMKILSEEQLIGRLANASEARGM